jgi:hypothetical protein
LNRLIIKYTAKLWRGIHPNDFDIGNVSKNKKRSKAGRVPYEKNQTV